MNIYLYNLENTPFIRLKKDIKQMECNVCKTRMDYYIYGRTQIFCPVCTTKLLQPRGQLNKAINANITNANTLKEKNNSVLDEKQLNTL